MTNAEQTYRFPVYSTRGENSKLLGYVFASSWIAACVEAGKRFDCTFAVRSGQPV